MKFCAKCGAAMKDDARFCNKCGSPFDITMSHLDDSIEKPDVIESGCKEAEQISYRNIQDKPTDKRKPKAILLIVIIVLIMVIATLVFFLSKKDQSGEIANKDTTFNDTEKETEVKDDVDISQYIDTWILGDGVYFTISKKDDKTVLVEFFGGGPSNNRRTASGTGHVENDKLIIDMTYKEYMADNSGNEAVYLYDTCLDYLKLCSSIDDDDYNAGIVDGERFDLNDYSQHQICFRENSVDLLEFWDKKSLSECTPKENYAICDIGGSKISSQFQKLYEENIFWYSSQIYLYDYQVMNLNEYSLKLARNEIYARHGRMFNNADLQEYFNSCSWYNPTTPPDQFDDNSLSEIEKANVKLIQSYEQ